MIALGHAGLFVCVFDRDNVSKANLGRQLFADAEIGLNKAIVLINRLNRFFGTNWKAFPYYYGKDNFERLGAHKIANLTITCADTVAARFEIAELLKTKEKTNYSNQPYYWIDFGNSQYTGQVVLSTVGNIGQPKSKQFMPVAQLPFITDEFKTLLEHSEEKDNTPSCSLAEALTKQDLFINSALAILELLYYGRCSGKE